MKTILCTILALLGSGFAVANSNFVSNPDLPYPSGCVRDMRGNLSGALAEQRLKFHESEIDLFDTQSGDRIPVLLTAYRSACAEPNRSLIWIEFKLSEEVAARPVELELPTFVAEPQKSWRYVMNLVTEPNGWGTGGHVNRGRTYLISRIREMLVGYVSDEVERKWVFLLDNAPAESSNAGEDRLSAKEYNAAFKLWLRFPPYDYLSIDVPAVAAMPDQSPVTLPLSGRHSGLWVIEGAANQGFQLSISEKVGLTEPELGVPVPPLVIFFSQYTFDSESKPMWLVGNVEFEPGASEITMPVARASNGEFRGSKLAERETIGSVTLRSKSCNDLAFDYDYSALGLGSGSARMQRLFSLEIAGFDCRDYDARVEANID